MELSEKLIEFMRKHIGETFEKDNPPTPKEVVELVYQVNIFTAEFIEESNYYLQQKED